MRIRLGVMYQPLQAYERSYKTSTEWYEIDGEDRQFILLVESREMGRRYKIKLNREYIGWSRVGDASESGGRGRRRWKEESLGGGEKRGGRMDARGPSIGDFAGRQSREYARMW